MHSLWLLFESYPKLSALIKEDFSALRYLLVIDENYNDEDTEEFDAIDPEDYNYLVYITELLQESITLIFQIFISLMKTSMVYKQNSMKRV